MNLALNKKWETHVNALSTDALKVIDIELTDKSVMSAVVVVSGIVHIPRNSILFNSDILDIKLHKI